MNLAEANTPTGAEGAVCLRRVPRYLYRKIINPSEILDSIKLIFSYEEISQYLPVGFTLIL